MRAPSTGTSGHRLDFKIILTGLGGQGVVFATRLLAQSALLADREVLASETHGMSQRGGSVLSHLKIDGSEAPLIRRGTADLVLGFERAEGLRCLPFLKEGGVAVINAEELPREIEGVLERGGRRAHVLPAAEKAIALGWPMLANVVLLGYAAAAKLLPLSLEELEAGLDSMGPRNRDANLRGLEAGRLAADRASSPQERAAMGGSR